jgi:hypothetical protein
VADDTPAYWLRRRAAGVAVEVDAVEADEIARRPGVIGDLGSGLVWQEPDPDSYSGSAFVTLTPVWEQ